jgi:hypothetical protein
MDDPTECLEWREIPPPPAAGPGSGRDAWRGFARRLAEANAGLVELVERLVEVNRRHRAEAESLHARLAARKPRGGRPSIPEETARRIAYDLAGGASARSVARRYRVSHTTVNRLAGRMRARERVAGAEASAA